MASATGVPEHANGIRGGGGGVGEDEPLLGRRGDASQMEGGSIWLNLWIGTAPLAQFGIWLLAGIVWGAIFSHNLIFFSAHPLLNSAGLLLVTQAALILQPTHTAAQKRTGTLLHALFHLFGLSSLLAGLVIIEVNKQGPGHEHFESPHAILGLIFYISIFLQALVGFTQYYTPGLYGSVDNAKAIYKYHRISGYVIATVGLATVCAATWTPFARSYAHMQSWSVVVAAVMTLVGVVPRIKLHKLGLKRDYQGRERLAS